MSALVAAISSDNNPSTLTKSELVAEISVFKLVITAASASSLVKSTALIIETISTKVSLSASEANKIASTLVFAESTSVLNPPSIPVALPASAVMLDCNVLSFANLVAASVDKSPVNCNSAALARVASLSTRDLMSDAFAIPALVTSPQFTVVKKSLICFERICAILFYIIYFWPNNFIAVSGIYIYWYSSLQLKYHILY